MARLKKLSAYVAVLFLVLGFILTTPQRSETQSLPFIDSVVSD